MLRDADEDSKGSTGHVDEDIPGKHLFLLSEENPVLFRQTGALFPVMGSLIGIQNSPQS